MYCPARRVISSPRTPHAPPARRAAPPAAPAAPLLGVAACFDAAAEDAPADGRVRVAHMLPPRSALSPLSDDAFKLSRWATAETLVVLDADGNALPALATEWTQDGASWTFTIRGGVAFHDGTALTPEAVDNALNVAAESAQGATPSAKQPVNDPQPPTGQRG
jgi:peptide/nickel transport system substrate-binding protein